jgi:hypothetical protein
MAGGLADKSQGLPDKMAGESLENPREILGCLQMIYSSYHLFFARYHQCMTKNNERAYPN